MSLVIIDCSVSMKADSPVLRGLGCYFLVGRPAVFVQLSQPFIDSFFLVGFDKLFSNHPDKF